MRSKSMALMWDLLSRTCWLIPMGIVGANFMPIFLMTALRRDGVIDRTDPVYVNLQSILSLMGGVTFGGIFLSTYENWPRYYTLPVRTSTLVAWRMFPAMALTALQSVLGTLLLNWMFDLDWPLWGPALFSAVLLGAIQAAILLGGESVLVPFCLAIASGIPGVWYKSRNGDIFSAPTQMWRIVTVGDAAMLFLFAAISYGTAVFAVARNRCGEPPQGSGLLAWFDSLLREPLDLLAAEQSRFQSPIQAYAWSKQRECGWIGPALVTIILFVGLTLWALFGRDSKSLIEGLVVGGITVSLGGMIGGLTLGNCGANDKKPEMSQFLGTRPITDQDLTSIILKLAARSALTSWCIWLTTSAVVLGLARLSGVTLDPLLAMRLQWWYLPATLLGCWITIGIMTSLSLTGQPKLVLQFFTAAVVIPVVSLMLFKLVSDSMREWISSSILSVLGIALVLGSVLVMFAAKRRSLITARVVVVAVCIWGVTSLVAASECLQQPVLRIPTTVFFTGLASLIVTPLFAAPLALTWNRHR